MVAAVSKLFNAKCLFGIFHFGRRGDYILHFAFLLPSVTSVFSAAGN
jgi:hypothetical protein